MCQTSRWSPGCPRGRLGGWGVLGNDCSLRHLAAGGARRPANCTTSVITCLHPRLTEALLTKTEALGAKAGKVWSLCHPDGPAPRLTCVKFSWVIIAGRTPAVLWPRSSG